jgi:hypothetical protein
MAQYLCPPLPVPVFVDLLGPGSELAETVLHTQGETFDGKAAPHTYKKIHRKQSDKRKEKTGQKMITHRYHGAKKCWYGSGFANLCL